MWTKIKRSQLIGILVVRDEVDIIRSALRQFLEWMDFLLILDTGSIDGTWEAIVQTASNDTRIIPISNTARIFTEDLRGYLHFHLQGLARKGDWIARVDADEIYAVNPKNFIQINGKGCDHVFARYYTFQPSLDDTRQWINQLREETSSMEAMQWTLPRTYYFHQSELRMYRYKGPNQWPAYRGNPVNLLKPIPYHLPVHHYPARTPLQLAKRQILRNLIATTELFRQSFPNADKHHWTCSWTSYLITNPVWPCLEVGGEMKYTDPDIVSHSWRENLRNRAISTRDLFSTSVHAANMLTPLLPPGHIKQLHERYSELTRECLTDDLEKYLLGFSV